MQRNGIGVVAKNFIIPSNMGFELKNGLLSFENVLVVIIS